MYDDAGTQNPVDEVVERVHKAVDEVNRLTYRSNDSNSSLNVYGATSWQMTVCLLLAIVGAMFGCFGLYIASDTRSQLRSDTVELRQDIKAIRAYINAGMVKSAQTKEK